VDVLEASDEHASVVPTGVEAERLTWSVAVSEPALLILGDQFYPGWRATVDGEPVPILRANIAFRAVLVPPGIHTVEMRYEPASFRYGLFTSLASIAIVTSVVAVSLLPIPTRGER
jgi:uncharacterized membrane protein YfhO